jgi:hypothetical protein
MQRRVGWSGTSFCSGLGWNVLEWLLFKTGFAAPSDVSEFFRVEIGVKKSVQGVGEPLAEQNGANEPVLIFVHRGISGSSQQMVPPSTRKWRGRGGWCPRGDVA